VHSTEREREAATETGRMSPSSPNRISVDTKNSSTAALLWTSFAAACRRGRGRGDRTAARWRTKNERDVCKEIAIGTGGRTPNPCSDDTTNRLKQSSQLTATSGAACSQGPPAHQTAASQATPRLWRPCPAISMSRTRPQATEKNGGKMRLLEPYPLCQQAGSWPASSAPQPRGDRAL
jgi:hypothetical protein